MDKKIEILEEKIDLLELLIKKLHEKIDTLTKKMDTDILVECQKMGSHIDFVENVYENVKNPLGYICKKVNSLTSKQYELT